MDEMKAISPVTIWKDGVSKTATQFNLRSIGDDLATAALFYYELRDEFGAVLTTGNITMDGQEYADWNSNPDANAEAYRWAASNLNLTII